MRARLVIHVDVDEKAAARALGIPSQEADDWLVDALQDYAQALVDGDLEAKGLAS